ncbi:MAG: PglZ domain-containing protein [Mariniphaga sp.]|nr:PglZ domain-containing protein [Mariniphaga sp.]
MIDTWFIHDIKKEFNEKQILVFIDPSGEAEFLLDVLPKEYIVLRANGELEELELRYKINKENLLQKLIIYTNTPKENLKFIREYCETNGCLEIRQIEQYIKATIHANLGLNLQFSKDELLTAAKISIGRDRSYWMELVHKGASVIFDLDQMLIPFLNNPKEFMAAMGQEVSAMFAQKVSDFIWVDFVRQAPQTLANQVAETMFRQLLQNNISPELKKIYLQWADSSGYAASFNTYVENFKAKAPDLWSVSVDHPFVSIDEQMLDEVITHSGDKDWLKDKLSWITQRSKNKIAKRQNIHFWSDLIQVLGFDSSGINSLDNLESVAAYYANSFYKLDRAIRKLYTRFLNHPLKMRPIQEIYEENNRLLLNQWFKHFNKYKTNQAGLLLKLMNEATENTAFIVGDAITYEIAASVSEKLNKDFNTSKELLFTGYPSVTEFNMSLMYQNDGKIEPIHKKREEQLQSQAESSIQFVALEDLSYSSSEAKFLVCSYKDMDSLGEKLQQKALKFIDEVEDTLAQKIKQIQQLGYQTIYLVSDHGFVLTGLLSESDKIEVSFTGNIQKSERFILSENQQKDTGSLIEIKQDYNNFRYIYFAQSGRPFKTPGVYGFSHGGITPQELIAPLFCFKSKDTSIEKLAAIITNKSELANVPGNSFLVNILAQKSSSLLDSARKCQLLLFADKKQITKSDLFNIQSGQQIQKEYDFDEHTSIDVILIDAETKEQMDKATAIKKQLRNLGGL